jgi:hypothetical protein
MAATRLAVSWAMADSTLKLSSYVTLVTSLPSLQTVAMPISQSSTTPTLQIQSDTWVFLHIYSPVFILHIMTPITFFMSSSPKQSRHDRKDDSSRKVRKLPSPESPLTLSRRGHCLSRTSTNSSFLSLLHSHHNFPYLSLFFEKTPRNCDFRRDRIQKIYLMFSIGASNEKFYVVITRNDRSTALL